VACLWVCYHGNSKLRASIFLGTLFICDVIAVYCMLEFRILTNFGRHGISILLSSETYILRLMMGENSSLLPLVYWQNKIIYSSEGMGTFLIKCVNW